ncbi:hypothetical protein Taro_007911 [Colocasia esculenta]|uniref:1,4-alpha-D-glucan glucanohydrolase n=1 Tax=Colocasia esculenta TaxID=4460 RepID=A0A843U1R5_COLES|nr:hypothetical protein [Colocasia esculenta]
MAPPPDPDRFHFEKRAVAAPSSSSVRATSSAFFPSKATTKPRRCDPDEVKALSFPNLRKCACIKGGIGMFNFAAHASGDDPSELSLDSIEDGNPSSAGNGEVEEIRIALEDSRSRLTAVEKKRDQLIEELARAEARQKEYAGMINHDKELAIAELEAAKSLFNQKLQESVDDKFSLESQLVLAKQDAVELAVQVEKLAEIAFQQATSHILEDASLRVSAAETSAAEAAYHIEEQIRNATEGTISSIVDLSTSTIDKALAAAEQASSRAKKAVSALSGGSNLVNEVATIRAQNIGLQDHVSELESQLSTTRGEIERLKSELEQALALAKASDLRAEAAEKALADLQEQIRGKSTEREEEIKSMIGKMKKEAADREKAAAKAFKAELEGIMIAVEAARETSWLKDQAYSRRCAALQRSLSASEAACEAWRRRAETAELLVQRERSEDGGEGLDYLVNGGRIDILTDDDSLKWKLLAEGPRREIPDWMARRIRAVCPKYPPKKTNLMEALATETLSLQLPKLEEVWSIAQEKPKETDVLVEEVIEKEVIEKKRKALERSLQKKTVKWQRTPEDIKLEPGTGTGREIVFQAFNWESWRRSWYTELAPKAKDLSQSGITAIWLPPPTESVAPQGYMPSDLYNLNSAYGTAEELKQCIDELHAHEILNPTWTEFPQEYIRI